MTSQPNSSSSAIDSQDHPIINVTPPTATETISELFSTSCYHLSFWDLLLRCVVVISAWTFMCMMLFGMNFTLHSFNDSRAASYTCLLSLALTFLVVSTIFLCLMLFLTHNTQMFHAGKSAFKNFFSKEHISKLVLLGFVDCCGSFCSTYAAPNVASSIQYALNGCSVVWTFLLAKWILPDRDRPCTIFVFIAVCLSVLGAVVTIIPQWSFDSSHHGIGTTIGWIVIFIGAPFFGLMINILYSKYLIDTVDHKGKSIIQEDVAVIIASTSVADLRQQEKEEEEDSDTVNENAVEKDEQSHLLSQDEINAPVSASSSSKMKHRHHQHQWPYFVTRLSIALFGDSFFQVIFILILIPLDFTPWFGASNSANQTTTWLREGMIGIFDSQSTTSEKNGSANTPLYFGIYFSGFLVSQMIGASLAYYSPQLTAFIYSINTPINLLCLVILPNWNIFGVSVPVWASLISIAFCSIGALMYAVWEHSMRKHQHDIAVASLENERLQLNQQQDQNDGDDN